MDLIDREYLEECLGRLLKDADEEKGEDEQAYGYYIGLKHAMDLVREVPSVESK